MVDYYPLIAKAVAGLEKNTGEARRTLYERARGALVTQLRSVNPPLSESDITRERLALEEAIRKVEADAARRAGANAGAVKPPDAAQQSAPSRDAAPIELHVDPEGVTRVFISYRRDDAAGHAGRVHDRLAKELGANLLFMDVDDIPLGVNFVKALHEAVAKCSVLLAVIGPDWLKVRDKGGRRRLDNPNDFVRVEIAAALQRKIPVIPILLEGTTVPRADQLPKDLQELSLHNGINVHHSSFHADMDRLIRKLGLKSADRPHWLMKKIVKALAAR